jgi:hypothetical protein
MVLIFNLTFITSKKQGMLTNIYKIYRFGYKTRLFYILGICFIFSELLSAQTKLLGEFSKVKTAGDVSVELIQSTENKAEYSILKGFERDLVFEINEDWLTVRIKAPEKSKYNRLVTKATVKLFYKEIKELNIHAISDVSSKDTITSPFLKINCNKGSRGTLILKCFDVKVKAQNKSTLYLFGKTETLKIESYSDSVIEAETMTAKEVEIIAEQNSRVSVFSDKAIFGKAGSGSKIKYKGNPQYKNISEEMGGKVTGPK